MGRLTSKYPNVRVVEERDSNISKARNSAISASSGEYVLNLSAHCYIESSCIETLMAKLQKAPPFVAGVGCADLIPPDQGGMVPRAFDHVLRSRLGGGLSYQQFASGEDCYYDHVALTLYRKSVFLSVGYYDPTLPNGDNCEFNMRLKEAGFKLIFTPETRGYRYRRETRKQITLRLFRYGVARGKIMRKHFRSSKKIYLVPILALMGLFVVGGFSLLSWLNGNPSSWAFLGVLALAYVLITGIASLKIAGFRDLRLAADVAISFVLVHFMTAFGELVGIL